MTSASLFAEVVLLAFWAVLIAELVGDRSMYALASLTLSIRWTVIFATFAIASATKMLAAVLLANLFVRFQSHWTYVISAVAFFVSAVLIWVDEPPEIKLAGAKNRPWLGGAFTCFCSFLFTEWGDPGQIAGAALVLKSHLLLATWLGATLALMVKGAAAVKLGLEIRGRIPVRSLRILSSSSCCILGALAVYQSVTL